MLQDYLSTIGGWSGYSLQDVRKGSDVVWIKLKRDQSIPGTCPHCGRTSSSFHDVTVRHINDLPVFGHSVILTLDRWRIRCNVCGSVVEQLEWLNRSRRSTTRLEQFVVGLCGMMPIKDVACITGLGWDAIKRIDKAHLRKSVGTLSMKGVRYLGMDEFAIQKGHRYATIVVDLETGRLLWVGRERSRETIRRFFEAISAAERKNIRAIAMDMSASYSNEVPHWCPKAKIVYDLFHVVAKYAREVVDRVRVDQANRLRYDRVARKVVKGTRWLLLRNPENIQRPEDQVRLSEVLAANRSIAKVYIMKDELKQIWRAKTKKTAQRRWDDWYRKAVYSRIAPLVKFAKALKKFVAGIIAHSQYAIHTSVIEGINNKIKVIKRRGYGYRDDEYFFLKLRAAFPGNRG